MSTYDYYRIFYHVAQHHSFTKAAEVLHNNQPNITRCMNNLETELGCHLFVRSNRGVSLTPEARSFLTTLRLLSNSLNSEKPSSSVTRVLQADSSPSESVKMHFVLCFCPN